MKAGDVNKQQDEPAEPESNIDFTSDAEKEAEGGSKTDVRGFELDNFDDASKGQKAIIDLELLNNWSRYDGDAAAQQFADEMMNLWSADEVQNYMKDNGWSENDSKVFAQTFADAEDTGTDEPTEPTDVPDTPTDTDDRADDKAPDDEWYGDDYQFSDEEDGYGDDDWYGDDDQFDINPDDYASTTRLGDSAEDYIAYDDDQEAYFIDSYDQDDSQVTVEPGDRIQFKNVDGQTVYGTVSDEASGRDDDVYKIDVDTIEESFTNPFESKLLKSIIKGKK